MVSGKKKKKIFQLLVPFHPKSSLTLHTKIRQPSELKDESCRNTQIDRWGWLEEEDIEIDSTREGGREIVKNRPSDTYSRTLARQETREDDEKRK